MTRAVWIGALGGALAGLASFAIELTLAVWSAGVPIPVAPRNALAYPATGALLGLALRPLLPRLRLPVGGAAVFAWSLAALQAIPLCERVSASVGREVDVALGLALGVAAGVAYLAGIALLGFLVGRRSWTTPFVAALGTAVFLAVNRNLYDSPFDPRALALDGVLAAGGVAAALLAAGDRVRRVVGLGLAACAGAGVLVSAPLPSPPTPEPAALPDAALPDVVLIVVDTLREDVFRDVVEHTEEGRAFRQAMDGSIWFSQATAAAPWTVPSMGSIMTGLHPREHGYERARAEPPLALDYLSPSVPTLAELLAERGYATHALVTNLHMREGTGMARGFHSHELLRGATWLLPLLAAGAHLELLDPEPYQRAEHVRSVLAERLPRIAATERPVFLWIHLMDPHEPLHEHPALPEETGAAARSEKDRLYRNETRYVLRETVRILAELERHDLFEDSLVVFCSDHGEVLPSDGRPRRAGQVTEGYGHGFALHDELVRVPLLIRLPGGRHGNRELDALASHVDLLPTIAGYAGTDVAEHPGRVDLRPWLEQGSVDGGREHALIGSVAYGPDQRGLRSRTLKLIEYPTGARETELYDLSSDPSEKRDLAVRQPERRREAARRLEALWARLDVARDSGSVEMDADTERQLRELGYLE